MKRPTTPPLPPYVEARMAKRSFIRLNAGNVVTAADRFAAAVVAGKQPDPDDIRIVGWQIHRVLHGESFRSVFGPGRRRPNDKTKPIRDQYIHAEMEELRRNKAMTLERAAELVGERYGLEPDTIAKSHKLWNRRKLGR